MHRYILICVFCVVVGIAIGLGVNSFKSRAENKTLAKQPLSQVNAVPAEAKPVWEGDLSELNIQEFRVSNASIADCLLELSRVKDVPFGLELLPGEPVLGSNNVGPNSQPVRVTLDLKNVAVGKILNNIVA